MLLNGKILVAGGSNTLNGALASAKLYDPIAGTWTLTDSMTEARFLHTTTLLPSGVLVVGGTADGISATADVELYDPTIGTWMPIPPLKYARFSHTATLLESGQVLVSGGTGGNGGPVAVCELYPRHRTNSRRNAAKVPITQFTCFGHYKMIS